MIGPKMRVLNRKTYRTGTICPDTPGNLSCNGPGEITVVYDQTTVGEGTQEDDLECLGPENAVPVPKCCGAGGGEFCCIFLTCGSDGFECQRHSSLRWALVFKSGMTAKRNPAEPFPLCMNGGK